MEFLTTFHDSVNLNCGKFTITALRTTSPIFTNWVLYYCLCGYLPHDRHMISFTGTNRVTEQQTFSHQHMYLGN
jgi:hypothetical protein